MANRRTAIPLTALPVGVIGSPQINTNMVSTAPTNGNSQSTFAQDHWTRYHRLKGVEDAKDALIEDVLSRYDAVVRQCQTLIDEQNAQNGNNNGTTSHSTYQQDQLAYIQHLHTLMDSNPFVVAVVDGNALLFNDSFLRDGEKGGRRAAVVLKDELTDWIPKHVEHAPSEFKILVKVYADFKGLIGTFMRGDIIESPSTFADFTRGFNTLFDFVDIGTGDANSRIVDHLKLFLHDYHCHQVIFGGDPQPLETNVEQNEKLQRRVALLQSVPTDAELPFKTVSFHEVFRTSKITMGIANITPRSATPASVASNNNGQPLLPPSRDSRVSSVAATDVPAVKTWAKLAQRVAPLPQTSTVPRAVEPPARRHNKKGQRIDPPFDLDWDELKRVKKIKMCNMFYLHPDGCKWSAERCNHRHDYDATDAEIKLLRSVSRETPCHNGVRCDELVCVHGHRCPFPPATEGSMRGLACTLGDKCRFPREMHGIKDPAPARATNTGKR